MEDSEDEDFAYGSDPELLEQFFSWSNEAVEELTGLSAELTGDETGSSESIARIYDLTHNIKGMGASFGYSLLTNVGQSLCGYIKDRDQFSPRVMQAHAKVLNVILENKIQGSGGEKGAAIEKRLVSIIAEED